MFSSRILRQHFIRGAAARGPPWAFTAPLARRRAPLCECRRSRHTYREAARILFRHHPFSMSLATLIILTGIVGLGFAGYIYKSYIIDGFSKYPEPVAVKLRRALFYTKADFQPEKAVKYYFQSLEVAREVGMDPLSEEVLGIKILLAELLEKVQVYAKAIEVLGLIRKDILEWIEEKGTLPGNELKRTRLLSKAVSIALKEGELYGNKHVQEKELAEERLVWAVEAALKERKRRDEEGEKPNEGEWMSEEQLGAALEALATHFEEHDLHYLAAPLHLRALTMIPWRNCHAVVLMNNLSASLAQQTPPPYPGGPPPPSRPHLIASGRTWARKAIALSQTIAPPDRTDECDRACAVATHNLAEFAEMDGQLADARRLYNDARSLAAKIAFRDGVRHADDALKRLRAREKESGE